MDLFSDLSHVKYDPSALNPLFDVGAFLTHTTLILFSPCNVLNKAMFNLGFWGTSNTTNNVTSESGYEMEDEPEDDSNNNNDDNDNDDDNDRTQEKDKVEEGGKDESKAEDPVYKEYVFFSFGLHLFCCRHQQSDPQELELIFSAICKRLPSTVLILKDNVQDIFALTQPVSILLFSIYLMLSRFVKVSMQCVQQIRTEVMCYIYV